MRGKATATVELGAKLNLSFDENGLGRIEKLSFDAYNENDVLVDMATRFKDRAGRYPELILADKIYYSRINLQYCKEHGIRLSEPSLGRTEKGLSADKKLDRTTKSSITLAILAMNIDYMTVVSLCQYMRGFVHICG